MKTNTYNWALAFFLTLILFSSCRKEEIPDIEDIPEAPCWELHPEIELDHRLLVQSFTTEDYIYLLSNNYFLKMDETGLLEEHFISEQGNLSLYDYPMLNDKIFAVGMDLYNLDTLEIFSTQNPDVSASIDLLSIDSTFVEINYFLGNGMCVNEDNKLLFSVRKNTDLGTSDPNLYFWMFDFTLDENNLIINFDKEVKIEISGSMSFYGSKVVSEMVVFENDFYCSIYNPSTTFRIDSEGSYEELFPLRDATIFSHNDTLFALGHFYDCDISYAVKDPQSSQWETLTFGVNDACWGRFYQIGGRFIMKNGNQLWELKINHSAGTYSLKELENNCVQKTSIRTVFKFQDKVYLCTPEGLYLKNFEDFFKYKEE
ncbi:MAG: hypothetical protein DWQ02_11400 [Bacteroidetes bacterium]|nr:MAG: hypothetical protein DWQ02_11400 [Bacteroidota bacterium]